MKNETTMTKKLTPAQAYAAQVRADRRAEARDDRRDPAIVADNARLNAMYGSFKVAPTKKTKKVSTKRVAWTAPEVDLLLDQYIKNVDLANLTYDRGVIEDAFIAEFGDTHASGVHFILCQIKHLDTYYPAQGMNSISPVVLERATLKDANRFSNFTTKEEKIVNALDNLLAEIRG